jgi:GNAT superfamily N-acetyltransferase
MSTEIQIRVAERSDRRELEELQALSFRTLGEPYYGSEAVEAFVRVGTMDPSLLDDGTYFVAVAGGRIVGCGGWSLRAPSYTAYVVDAARSEGPGATIRSVYVHPAFARRGIARAVMARIELELAKRNLDAVSLAATLSGIPLYRRIGYKGAEPIILRLPTGHQILTLAMTKQLTRTRLENVA